MATGHADTHAVGRSRLVRIVTMLAVAFAAVVLVTAVADISVAPRHDPAAQQPGEQGASAIRARLDPRSDLAGEQTSVEVLEHEGGLADAQTWLTDRVDSALAGLEKARLRTRELLPL